MDKKLDCGSLPALIEDERKAVIEYNDFAKTTDCDVAKTVIHSLARDEQKHHDMLVELKAEFCK